MYGSIYRRTGPGTRTALLCMGVVVLLAGAVQRNRVWIDAVTLWSNAATLSPGKVRVYNNLGNAYMKGGQYAQALWCYERSRQLEPTLSIKAYGNIGNVYVNMGEYGKAVEMFSLILSINTADVLSYIGRGKALFGLERYAEAREDFDRAIAMNPGTARFYLYRGEAYLMSNAPERGRADVTRSCDMGWQEACGRLAELSGPGDDRRDDAPGRSLAGPDAAP